MQMVNQLGFSGTSGWNREGCGSVGQQCWVSSVKLSGGGSYRAAGGFISIKGGVIEDVACLLRMLANRAPCPCHVFQNHWVMDLTWSHWNWYWSILDLSPHHGNKPWVLSLERLMVDFTFEHWFLGWGNCYLVICGHRPLQRVNRMLVHDGDMFRPQYSALLYHWKNLVCHFIVFNFLLLHYFWNWEGRNKTAFVHRCHDCLWENPKESVKKSSWN